MKALPLVFLALLFALWVLGGLWYLVATDDAYRAKQNQVQE